MVRSLTAVDWHPLTALRRAHPATEVFVTGDFDNWQKTVRLENENGVFRKTVDLPKAKHLYKVGISGATRL